MIGKIGLVTALFLAALLGGPSPAQAITRVQAGDSAMREVGVRISSGEFHTCAVKGDGTVRCWGLNDLGQLGDGTTTNRPTPVTVSGLAGAVAVAAGERHSCALLADGTVRCWGRNSSGQSGDGTTTLHLTPVTVSGLTAVVALTAGLNHTCALRADGTARCWGSNTSGQVGDGTTTNRLSPVAVSGLNQAVALAAGGTHTCALRVDGTARCWGSNGSGQVGDGTSGTNRLSPVVVSGLNQAVALSAGGAHTCVLRVNGTAACWGLNTSGQLGDGTTTARLTPVAVNGLSNGVTLATGTSHACARLADGTASCWGSNTDGQVGDGTSVNRLFPVAVIGLHSNATVALAAGQLHTCAVQDEDTAHCWGNNKSGQLGDGTTTSRTTPNVVAGGGGSISGRTVAVSGAGAHSCARRANGTVACWGFNDLGQLGDGTTTDRLTPVAVTGLTGAVSLTAGQHASCAAESDGAATCWGGGVPAIGPGLTNAVILASGALHTCALLANGTVRCWGNNASGQLGDGTTIDHNPNTNVAVSGLTDAVAVVAGQGSACALRVNGTAVCWGSNNSGQLGDGTTSERLTPVPVSGLTDAVALAAGIFHTCALRVNGTVVCWGHNNDGQLGDGTHAFRLSPVAVGGGLTDAVALAAGQKHTCALRADGTITCWGDNSSGQLGDGTTTGRVSAGAVVKTPRGGLQAGGLQAGVLQAIVTLAAGELHTCAVRTDGQLFCWGFNSNGQLGDGTTTTRLTAAEVPSFRFNIDPTVEIDNHGRVAIVTALVNCPEDEYFWVHVSLTQGTLVRHGTSAGACTGGLERYPVRVPTPGRQLFSPGPGQAAADAAVLNSLEIDTQEWSRAVQLVVPD